MLLLHRIPFSTNVERVEIALGLKGVPFEYVDHDPADRSSIRAVSGQDLVPVVELDGEVLADSPSILRWIERRWPDPPLWPADPARRAETDTFIDWFNLVWKGPPNEIDALLGDPEPDRGASRSSRPSSRPVSSASRRCSTGATSCSATCSAPPT